MKVVKTKRFPFGNFRGIMLFGILFWKGKEYPTTMELTHERIHERQMLEMLVIPFYVWYFLEWVVRLFIDPNTAYRSISFEREAYDNQKYYLYLDYRKPFSWLKYIRKKVIK